MTQIPRVGDIRAPKLKAVLICLSVLTFVVVLYVTSYMNFYYDEWDTISWFRSWNLSQLFWPHNEHWSTVPTLIWKLLFVAFGLKSHIPYEGTLLVAHVTSVLLLFALTRRRSGDLPAFASALIFLFLGSGGTNIVWAFQIGFVGSVAFGLWAMLLLDGDPTFKRGVVASAALLCSLMCSSVGLAFAAAVGAEVMVDSRRRRFLAVLVVPIAAFVVWFLAFDTGSVPGLPGASASLHHAPIGWTYIIGFIGFAVAGLAATAGGIFGLPIGVGVLLLPILAVMVGLHVYRQKTVWSWQIGTSVGLLAWLALTGFGRAQYGLAAAGESRYIYVGVVFLLPLVADAFSELPWRQLWRPVLIAALALGLFANVLQLRDRALVDPVPGVRYGISHTDLMKMEDAELQTVEVFRGAPDMALYRPLDALIMPQLVAARYYAAVDELGSPVPPATFDTLKQLPPDAVDRVMLNLFGPALAVNVDNTRRTDGLPCRIVDSAVGSTLNVRVPEGSQLMIQSSKGGSAALSLWLLGSPPSEPLRQVQLLPGTQEWLHLPRTGKPVVWQLRIKTQPMGVLHVCGITDFEAKDNRVFRANAAVGRVDPGWSTVGDPGASGGSAAKAAAGTTAGRQVVFGTPIPISATYDVWFRVRVASTAGIRGEMTLGLWDDSGMTWAGSTTYKSNQIGAVYQWVRVATQVTAMDGHYVQFLARTATALTTDWYADEAVMVLYGSPPPT